MQPLHTGPEYDYRSNLLHWYVKKSLEQRNWCVEINSALFVYLRLISFKWYPLLQNMLRNVPLRWIWKSWNELYHRRIYLIFLGHLKWVLKHTLNKNGSKRPAFLWHISCQNHFGHQNRLRIHTRGCTWVKCRYKFFLIYPHHVIEAISNRLDLRLSQKSWSRVYILK